MRGVSIATPVERPYPELLGAHRVKVRFSQGGTAICGRGGIRAVTHTRIFDTVPEHEVVLRVGEFIEIAGNCALLIGGEHKNDRVLNMSFGAMPLMRSRVEASGVAPLGSYSRGPITIGSGVIISYGATIRSGVSIGEGAVIGANAMVVKDVPPFAIVAGNPARVVRMRFDDTTIEALLRLRWWDLSHESLMAHAAHIERIAEPTIREQLLSSTLEYETADDFMVFSRQEGASSSQFGLLGIERAGVFTEAAKLPEIYQFFFQQLGNAAGQPTYYFENIFRTADALSA